jgi:transglutaminase-like putative cysteine protease
MKQFSLALAAIVVLLVADCNAQTPTTNGLEKSPEPQSKRYTIELRDVHRVVGTLTYSVSYPDFRANEWVIVAAIAPELPGQVKVKTSLEPAGISVTDQSPLARSLLMARVPVKTPKLLNALTITVTYEATLRSRTLQPLSPKTKVGAVPDLFPEDRKMFLIEHGDIDFGKDSFKKWLKNKGLVRHADESDIDFARRAFNGTRSSTSYEYRPRMDRRASAVCRAGRSDCGGMSNLFVSILRANEIPARTLWGSWAKSAKPADYGHVKAEFFADGVGWVPIDISEGVFGKDGGDFITIHIDPNLQVDTDLFGIKPVYNLQTPSWWVRGLGSLDSKRTRWGWQVTGQSRAKE